MARDDDPDDDALDREQTHPMMAGGPKHAPKLGTEPRAVSLAEVREEYELPSEKLRQDAPQPMLIPIPNGAPRKSPLSLRPTQTGPTGGMRTPFRTPTARGSDVDAWDRYVIAALPLVVGLVENTDQAAELAGQFADRLLVERQRRFS